MNKVLISLLAAAFLVGCAGKPREGGAAPVESVRGQKAPNVVAPVQPEPVVDVYAYRSPGKTPPPPPPAGQSVEPGGSAGTMLALRSETPGTVRVPRTNGTAKPQEIDPGLAPAISWTPPAASAAAPKAPPIQAGSSASASGVANPVPSKSSQGANSASSGGTPPKATALIPVKPAPPPPPPPVVKYAAPPPPAPALPSAASSLAAQAEQQRERGDYVGAAATLERAIRIQPREAYLWNRLARVRLDQNNYDQAGSLAQKSNTLSKDQDQIKQDNWGMIAATRRAAGDQNGAQEAEAKAGSK